MKLLKGEIRKGDSFINSMGSKIIIHEVENSTNFIVRSPNWAVDEKYALSYSNLIRLLGKKVYTRYTKVAYKIY